MKSNNNGGSKKKQIISTIIAIIALVIIFAFVLPSLGNYDQAFESIKAMTKFQIAVLTIFTLANILVYVFPYMAALPRLKYSSGFVLRQTSFLISNSVPGGGAIGFGVQYAMLSSYGFKASASTSAIALTGAWNMLATISLPGIAALGLVIMNQLDSQSAIAALVGVGVAVLSLGLFIVVFKSKKLAEKIGQYMDKIIAKIASIFKMKRPASLKKSVMDFRESAYDTTVNRWKLLASTNYLQQLMQFSVLFVALQILDPGSISFTSALAAFAISRLGTFIPITPGGVGTVDALLVSSLTQAGVPNDIALAATLIWRFATFVPQLFIGGATFIYWRAIQARKLKNS